MKFKIDLQNPDDIKNIPTIFEFNRWVTTALSPHIESGELSIRVVSKEEMQALNNDYRKQNKPTNVLSFPIEVPEVVELPSPLLGDIIICAAVVEEEAAAMAIDSSSHWAHMSIHGALHLLGFDHIKPADALIMEPLEITCLAQLGIANPYLDMEADGDK